MPLLASIFAEITTTVIPPPVSPYDHTVTQDGVGTLNAEIETTNADPEIELTLDHSAQLAAASSFQRIGVRIDIDLGSGLETIPAEDLGIDVSITESLDNYADQLTFSLIGERYSPFARSVIRAKREVAVGVYYGSPGAEFFAWVFRGVIVSAVYGAQPPVATIIALDKAALYATKKAKDYTLAPNSKRYRLSVLQDLIAIAGMPVREIDLGGDGGSLSKAVTPGDAFILDYIRDYLSPTGAMIGFEDGGFVARRYRADDPVTMSLTPADLCAPLTIVPPATMAETGVTVVALKSGTATESGLTTVTDEVTTMAPYSPAQWVQRQDGDGSLHANGAGLPAAYIRVVSRVVTVTTFMGSTAIRTEVTEYGWYARKGARLVINDDEGNTITPFPSSRYLFPDGSWRAEPVETFRRVRKTITSKDLDADQNVIRITEQRYFYHFLRAAIWQVAGFPALDYFYGAGYRPILEDGGAVVFSQEYMILDADLNLLEFALISQPDSQTITDFELNADGAIAVQAVTDHYYDIGNPRSKSQAGSFGYGIDNRVYTDRPSEGAIGFADTYGGLKVTRTTYRETGEDSFQSIQSTTVNGGVPTTVITSASGSLPRPERISPKSAAQEISATVTDSLRVSMNGEIGLPLHNEFVENADEARVVAITELRHKSGIQFTFDMPIEGVLHKWKTVTLDFPSANVSGLRLFVWQIARNFARFRQTVTAFYYPPDIQ